VPDIASILALQRSVGNRALQRLFYGRSTGNLVAPRRYANQFIPWTGDAIGERRGLSDPTLASLVANDAAFKRHFANGMNLPDLQKVTAKSEPDIRAGVASLNDGADQATLQAAQDAAVDLDRVIVFENQYDTFSKREDLDIRWVISTPDDFVPGANDLPGPNVDLGSHAGGAKTNTYFKLACVLIALAKHDTNYAKLREITGAAPNDIKDAVQALHRHYATEGVQYDDTATRFQMMNAWGYKAIFTSGCTWADLPKHVAMTTNKKYIFDIEGHTVCVRAKRDIALDPNGTLANPRNYLEPDSHEDNYKRGTEFDKAIKYIWEKQ
jgi:hypothetical protein